MKRTLWAFACYLLITAAGLLTDAARYADRMARDDGLRRRR